MPSKPKMRQDLCAPALYQRIRSCFDRVEFGHCARAISTTDLLMSGLAIFALKYPSLLQYDQARREQCTRHNLSTLFGIENAPCDTYLRERLDEIDPRQIRHVFKSVFSVLQRGKALETMTYLNGHYLLSLDGTGFFSSKQVHCEHCCTKVHRDGTKTYYHQALCAALVHPECAQVFPLAPEPILVQDGSSKNDCERNAAKRLLGHIRREHPHLKCIVVEDGLASNAPHIQLLKELNFSFILGAKRSDHQHLFQFIECDQLKLVRTHEYTDQQGVKHRFRYCNDSPLNKANHQLKVNFIEYWETDAKGKEQHFAWVTDITLTEENLMTVMKAARARWRIENEVFNTLKNQGYQFEHNFGHGYNHLSTNMAYLMLLAFLVDQVQQHCCKLYQEAMRKAGRRLYFFNHLKRLFFEHFIPDWKTLYESMIYGYQKQVLTVDSG